jgi:CubicO group peptidase (beta-lactamase class C family)
MDAISRRSRLRTSLLAFAISLLLGGCGESLEVDLPAADRAVAEPEDLSWLAKSAIDVFLDVNAWVGSQAGYVAVFARDGRVVHATTSGHADIESRRPMQLDTRFRMASMTKPVTAAAALVLVEAGRLGLDDSVERYIPAAGALRVAAGETVDEDGALATVALLRPLTVRHLLTFTAGIGSEEDPSELGKIWATRDIYAGTGSLEQRVNRILTAPLYEQPGGRWRYGWTADVLALVVEVAAGEPFDRFLERAIFAPLGMSSTSFLPPEGGREDLATVYTQDADRNLVRVESPESDAVDWTPGGSGLVATAADYMRFALMLWNGGSYDGVRILTRESVDLMTQSHVGEGVLAEEGIDGVGWGMGVAVVVDSDATPMIDRNGDYWWAGYYATHFFVSPETGLVGVVLAQNQPGPFSRLPYAVFLAQAFAYWGL